MPRPKGSKNKNTLARQETTSSRSEAKPQVSKPTHPSSKSETSPLLSEPLVKALTDFEDKLQETVKQVTDILTTIAEDFESLCTKVNTGVSAKAATPKSVVEEREPEFDDMTIEELEDFIEENDLDVDLDEYKGLSKKRQAVADAYEDTLNDEDEDEDDEDGEDGDEEDDDDDDWDDDKPAKANTGARRSGKR